MYKNNKRFIQGFIVLISLLSGLGVAGSAIAADQPAQGGNGQTENSVFTNFTPVTDEMIQNPDPADWLTWRRTLNAWGHSPLDQINTNNVDELRMVWVRGIGDGI